VPNLFLTGFMATGKTVVGREIAEIVGWRFVDTDREVEEEAGLTVAGIFERFGEPVFREREARVLERICAGDRSVVATGGGIVLAPANRARMRAAGRVVCLVAAPEVIVARIGSGGDRPLLAAAADPLERVRGLLAERAPAYADADLRLETSSLAPRQAAERIVDWMRTADSAAAGGS
jgi:shikimate kinase